MEPIDSVNSRVSLRSGMLVLALVGVLAVSYDSLSGSSTSPVASNGLAQAAATASSGATASPDESECTADSPTGQKEADGKTIKKVGKYCVPSSTEQNGEDSAKSNCVAKDGIQAGICWVKYCDATGKKCSVINQGTAAPSLSAQNYDTLVNGAGLSGITVPNDQLQSVCGSGGCNVGAPAGSEQIGSAFDEAGFQNVDYKNVGSAPQPQPGVSSFDEAGFTSGFNGGAEPPPPSASSFDEAGFSSLQPKDGEPDKSAADASASNPSAGCKTSGCIDNNTNNYGNFNPNSQQNCTFGVCNKTEQEVKAPPGNPGPGPGPTSGPGPGIGQIGNNTNGSGLGSLLSGLAQGLARAMLAPQPPPAPPAAPAQACSNDPNAYAQQQQQYQQQLQQYNYQLQQYQYQQQQYQYQQQYQQQYGGSISYFPPAPPQQPVACTPSTQSQCSLQPQQPAASSCTGGSWSPQMQGSCIVGWQCSNLGAQLSCSPQTADVGSTLSISYSCAQGTASSSGFDASGQSGTTTVVVAAPPSGSNTATYRLTCTNGAVTSGAQCSVQVVQPNIILVANPATVSSGARSLLGWITTGMQSCVISARNDATFTSQNAANTSVNGSVQTPALTAASNEFDLTCLTITGRTKTASTIVKVPGGGATPEQSSITATSTVDGGTLQHGQNVTITWQADSEPSGAKVSLWVYDPHSNTDSALIAGARPLSGAYTWNVPAANSLCPSDGSFNVCGADLVVGRQYQIEADVYTPGNAYVGDGPPPQNPVEPVYGDYVDLPAFTVGQ